MRRLLSSRYRRCLRRLDARRSHRPSGCARGEFREQGHRRHRALGGRESAVDRRRLLLTIAVVGAFALLPDSAVAATGTCSRLELVTHTCPVDASAGVGDDAVNLPAGLPRRGGRGGDMPAEPPGPAGPTAPRGSAPAPDLADQLGLTC